jgi:hypothetical protein
VNDAARAELMTSVAPIWRAATRAVSVAMCAP